MMCILEHCVHTPLSYLKFSIVFSVCSNNYTNLAMYFYKIISWCPEAPIMLLYMRTCPYVQSHVQDQGHGHLRVRNFPYTWDWGLSADCGQQIWKHPLAWFWVHTAVTPLSLTCIVECIICIHGPRQSNMYTAHNLYVFYIYVYTVQNWGIPWHRMMKLPP